MRLKWKWIGFDKPSIRHTLGNLIGLVENLIGFLSFGCVQPYLTLNFYFWMMERNHLKAKKNRSGGK